MLFTTVHCWFSQEIKKTAVVVLDLIKRKLLAKQDSFLSASKVLLKNHLAVTDIDLTGVLFLQALFQDKG